MTGRGDGVHGYLPADGWSRRRGAAAGTRAHSIGFVGHVRRRVEQPLGSKLFRPLVDGASPYPPTPPTPSRSRFSISYGLAPSMETPFHSERDDVAEAYRARSASWPSFSPRNCLASTRDGMRTGSDVAAPPRSAGAVRPLPRRRPSEERRGAPPESGTQIMLRRAGPRAEIATERGVASPDLTGLYRVRPKNICICTYFVLGGARRSRTADLPGAIPCNRSCVRLLPPASTRNCLGDANPKTYRRMINLLVA